MNRLQRKCLVASASAHGFLLLLLFAGSAFVTQQPVPPEMPLLDVIPSTVVDSALFGGGGNPEVQTAPAPAPSPVARTEPPPQRLAPEPAPEPLPAVRTRDPEVKVAESKPATPKPKPRVQVQTKTTRVTQPVRPGRETRVQPQVADELASRFERSTSRINQQLTPRTTIGVPGPGGPAFANYSQVVISIYQRNWIKPVGVEEPATVKATVTVARDGRVLSARLTRLSGNRTVDDSVEQVLQRVKEIRPFPEGAKDETRTFDLSFELTPTELSG